MSRNPQKQMNKTKLLKSYLVIFGVVNLVFVSTLPVIFGDLFLWKPRNIPTEIMMASIYFSMGLMMLIASKNPKKHKLFVDFLVVSNTLHAIVMLLTAQTTAHIYLDVIPIALMGLLPLFFYPWGLGNFLIKNVEA